MALEATAVASLLGIEKEIKMKENSPRSYCCSITNLDDSEELLDRTYNAKEKIYVDLLALNNSSGSFRMVTEVGTEVLFVFGMGTVSD